MLLSSDSTIDEIVIFHSLPGLLRFRQGRKFRAPACRTQAGQDHSGGDILFHTKNLCLNVLEHTFNPITILDNLCGLLKPGGYLLISTPLMWPLHSYPYDFWRPLPNFYEQYATRNNLELPKDRFKYLGFGLVEEYATHSGTTGFPSPVNNKLRFNWGKLIHRLFNTFGRQYLYPNHLALALTLKATCPTNDSN